MGMDRSYFNKNPSSNFSVAKSASSNNLSSGDAYQKSLDDLAKVMGRGVSGTTNSPIETNNSLGMPNPSPGGPSPDDLARKQRSDMQKQQFQAQNPQYRDSLQAAQPKLGTGATGLDSSLKTPYSDITDLHNMSNFTADIGLGDSVSIN